MINIELLSSLISIGLLFVLFVTKAYKKSITTTIYIVSLSMSAYLYSSCCEDAAFVTIVIGAIVSLARAVVNAERDKFIKRGHGC